MRLLIFHDFINDCARRRSRLFNESDLFRIVFNSLSIDLKTCIKVNKCVFNKLYILVICNKKNAYTRTCVYCLVLKKRDAVSLMIFSILLTVQTFKKTLAGLIKSYVMSLFLNKECNPLGPTIRIYIIKV